MAAGDPYITNATLAAYIASVNNEATINIDNRAGELTAACSSASRLIEQHCGRVFWDAGSATARTFRTDDMCLAEIDDISTATGLVVKTDETADGTFDTTWAAADYQLEPANGVWNSSTGWPYWKIRAIESRRFPTGTRYLIEVTAQWGWAAVPAEVTQAALILAHRLYKRAETPEGVAGFADFGAVRLSRIDHDVQTLLAPYRRNAMLVT